MERTRPIPDHGPVGERIRLAVHDADLPTLREVLQPAEDVSVDGNGADWLDSAHPSLDGVSPRRLLDTPEGRQRVLVVLVGARRGFPA